MTEVAIPSEATCKPAWLAMSMWIPAILLIASLTVTLVLVVHRDGLGHRPPPASHREWFEQLP